jgi:hypothetical protein
MDGMGDLDNAPMPPTDADNMGGMEDPSMMGGQDPMNDPMGGDMGNDPNAMNGGEDDELMNIINNLSIEDKAAVTKYAKSMADGNDDTMPQDPNAMPMESKVNYKGIIDEVINDVLDNKEGTKRPEKNMPSQYKHMDNPFKSPY